MTFGSLFAGIGGMDLGLEWAGMQCVWQVEIDPFCRKVLEKHWPNVRRHDDVKTFPPSGDWGCDLIAGGFPCQPVSHAGLSRGEQDERWLWPEFARIIRLLRPRIVLLENTTGLLATGFGSVLGDLAALGFDAEWSVLSACRVVAPHPRERVFVVAYAAGVMGQAGLRIRQQGAPSTIQPENAITTRVLRMEAAHRDSGVPDGFSTRVGQGMRAYGNAVVPQVAEWIGRRIMEVQPMPDNQRLAIRLSPEEKAIWSRCASQRGLSLSDWIRTTLNNHAAAVQRKRLHEEHQRELPDGWAEYIDDLDTVE